MTQMGHKESTVRLRIKSTFRMSRSAAAGSQAPAVGLSNDTFRRVSPIPGRPGEGRETVNLPATPEPATAPDIPAKKAARVRTLVKYGMTVSQVADIYGVPVEAIERIIQKA
jgi:hypothetical protein